MVSEHVDSACEQHLLCESHIQPDYQFLSLFPQNTKESVVKQKSLRWFCYEYKAGLKREKETQMCWQAGDILKCKFK